MALLRQSARNLDVLIGDILDNSRIEAGALTLVPGPVELRQLCREVGALFTARVEARGLRLPACAAPVGVAPGAPRRLERAPSVLPVEDNAINQPIIRALLEREGCAAALAEVLAAV